MGEWAFTLSEHADPAKVKKIHDGLRAHDLDVFQKMDRKDLLIEVHDGHGKLLGGLVGATFWKWLTIDYLWVEKGSRKKGMGKELVVRAEAEALKRGCLYSRLDTDSYQAPDFYKNLGYEIFGVLEDYPGENKRIFFQKRLVRN